MNEKTLQLLEFETIRAAVASCSLSEEAAELIRADNPRTDEAEAENLTSLVQLLCTRFVCVEGERRDSFPAIRHLLSKLDVEGTTLEIDELYALGIFIERAETFKQWLTKPLPNVEDEDTLSARAADLPSCAEIAASIFKILDRDGNLRDLGELRDIRKRITALQKEIETAGLRYVKSDETRRMLQSEIPSQRDGRIVLAVKANYRARIRGIVHEVSSSGQTVFVEPEDVVEKNNALLFEKRKLEMEIRRILKELSARIAPCCAMLQTFHAGIIFLETIRARARYGFEKKWNFANHTNSVNNSLKLTLKKARHPLLGDSAVPLDLAVNSEKHTVIITGPNTGGKTVALKTVGLLAMMNQFGLALPADEGTQLPMFDGIFADIGDEQSISQSLSTFSAHMKNISAILSRASNRSLVLLDELGSGTDPTEGSAIAMAILDHLIEKKSLAIVTTHHGVLKNYGYTKEGVENASMEFDSRTLSPTFRIIMGLPGESRAVDIASRNGLPFDVLQRAKTYLDEERSDVSSLIAGLKEKHRELDAAVTAANNEECRVREDRRRIDLKELSLRQKEMQLRQIGVGSLNTLLGESRKTLENLVREVKEGELNREKTLKVKEFLSDLEASVQNEFSAMDRERVALSRDLHKEAPSHAAAGSVLQPGIEVMAGPAEGSVRRRGRIIKLNKKSSGGKPASWLVEIGSLKMSFLENELSPVSPGKKDSGAHTASWTAELAPSTPASFEVSLRGMRLDEALESLRKQLDAAVLGGLSRFAVIHGKGEGILRKGVHDFLQNDPRVADFCFSRPELGGFGRTEVTVK